MKVFALLASVMIAAPSFAQAENINCSLGELGADNHVQVIFRDSRTVQFELHETSFSASRAEVAENGNSVAILNRKLNLSAEGERFEAVVDALMIYNPADKTLNLTLIIDGGVHTSAAELNCK